MFKMNVVGCVCVGLPELDSADCLYREKVTHVEQRKVVRGADDWSGPELEPLHKTSR